MRNKNTYSVQPAFELVRKIKYSNEHVADWGPLYFVKDENDAVEQMWSDLEVLTKQHVNANEPFKMSFVGGDSPTASFTWYDTHGGANTITWHIEKRTKIVV